MKKLYKLIESIQNLSDPIVAIGLIIIVVSTIIILCALPTGYLAGISGILLFSFMIFYLWFFGIE